MGGIPLTREGEGPSRQKSPPAASPPPRASFKSASGRAGESPSPPPPPPPPAQAVQHLRGRQGPGTRAHGPTPQRVSQPRTHTYTHNSKQRVWTPLSPPSPQAGEGGASPPQPLCKVSFGAASCGGEGDPAPRREGLRTLWGSPAPQESRGPPVRPLRGSGRPPGCGCAGRTPDAGDSRVSAEVFPWFPRLEPTDPSETGSWGPQLPELGTGHRKLPHQRQDFPNLPAQHVQLGTETAL